MNQQQKQKRREKLDWYLFLQLQHTFPPPSYLLQHQLRPWLLSEVERYVDEHDDELARALEEDIYTLKALGWDINFGE